MAKTLIGTVASDSQDKTISVKVVTHKTHPVYKKSYISSKKFAAHDENNEARLGDRVKIVETLPISSSKRFKLDKVTERAKLTAKDTEGVGEVEAKAEKNEPNLKTKVTPKVKSKVTPKTKATAKGKEE